jgi:hypothetical protein
LVYKFYFNYLMLVYFGKPERLRISETFGVGGSGLRSLRKLRAALAADVSLPVSERAVVNSVPSEQRILPRVFFKGEFHSDFSVSKNGVVEPFNAVKCLQRV